MDTSVPEGVASFRIRCHIFCFSPCWTQFLKDILRLPAAVGERQTFNMNNDSGNEAIFDPEAKVNGESQHHLLLIWLIFIFLKKGDCDQFSLT